MAGRGGRGQAGGRPQGGPGACPMMGHFSDCVKSRGYGRVLGKF